MREALADLAQAGRFKELDKKSEKAAKMAGFNRLFSPMSKPLTSEQRDQLKEILKSPASQRKRMRAHAILLSERHYSIDQIADLYQVDRDRVSQWLDWWEEFNFDGLEDDPRGGRPPKLHEEEQQRAIEIVRKEPRSTQQGLQRIADEIGQVIRGDPWKSILKAADDPWKRMRRSLRFDRDEDE